MEAPAHEEKFAAASEDKLPAPAPGARKRKMVLALTCVLLTAAAVGGAVGGTWRKQEASTAAGSHGLPLLTVKLVQSLPASGGSGRRLLQAQSGSVQALTLNVMNVVLERPNGDMRVINYASGISAPGPLYAGVSLFNNSGAVDNNANGAQYPLLAQPGQGALQSAAATCASAAALQASNPATWVDLANQSDVDAKLGRAVAVPPGTYTFFTVQYGPMGRAQGSVPVVNVGTGAPSGVSYYTRPCGVMACGAKCMDTPLASCSNGAQYVTSKKVTPTTGASLGAISAQGDVWTSTAGLRNAWPPSINQTQGLTGKPTFANLGAGDGFWMRGCAKSLAVGPAEPVTAALGFSGININLVFSAQFLQPVVVPSTVATVFNPATNTSSTVTVRALSHGYFAALDARATHFAAQHNDAAPHGGVFAQRRAAAGANPAEQRLRLMAHGQRGLDAAGCCDERLVGHIHHQPRPVPQRLL